MLLTMTLLTGCEYKDLCYDHNHSDKVYITFDWRKVPHHTATSMTVLFYNLDKPSQQPIRYEYPLSGGTATLQPGRWKAVTYNSNTEAIRHRGQEWWDIAEVFTRQSSIEEGSQLTRGAMPQATGAEQEQVILEPDPIWGCVSEDFNLVVDGDGYNLVLMPEYRYTTLKVKITDVPNLEYTNGVGGSISGVAASRFIASGELGQQTVTEAFPVNKTDNTLEMSVNIFGHCPESPGNTHLLTIYAILADGSKWYYTIDVTDKIHQAVEQDDGTMEIEVSGLPIPKPIVNGSGFRPTIDTWQGVEIEVGM
jgi:hypothetical protein